MKDTYTVTGMTCNGCRTSVEDALNAIDNVIKATVDLKKTEASVEMSKHISIDILQKQYQINSQYQKKRNEHLSIIRN